MSMLFGLPHTNDETVAFESIAGLDGALGKQTARLGIRVGD
jgi:hypothetical protein